MNEMKEICSAVEIRNRVLALAEQIKTSSRESELTILGFPEDSFMFLADLLRALHAHALRTVFLRYEHRDLGGLQDLSFTTQTDLSGRDVILVAGVLDTGVPQEYLVKQLEARGAKSVRLCVLVDKPDRRRASVKAEWAVFETREDYVFGYGLGFQERWRELPFLATLGAEGDAGRAES